MCDSRTGVGYAPCTSHGALLRDRGSAGSVHMCRRRIARYYHSAHHGSIHGVRGHTAEAVVTVFSLRGLGDLDMHLGVSVLTSGTGNRRVQLAALPRSPELPRLPETRVQPFVRLRFGHLKKRLDDGVSRS